jgi:putative (di)nucleoside polyphosphate hydrolase
VSAGESRDFDPALYRKNVGIVLINGAKKIFVAQRIDAAGAWQMPQGGIDAGEAPVAAAMRELEEEIGTAKAVILGETSGWLRYDLPEELCGKLWGGRYRGQIQKWFAARFTGRDEDIDLATAHPEFDAWKWVEPPEVIARIVPFKRAIYEAVLAEFSDLLR